LERLKNMDDEDCCERDEETDVHEQSRTEMREE